MRQKEIYKLAAGVLACSMLLGGCGDAADEPVPSDTEVSAPVDVSTTTTHFDKWTPSVAQDEPTTLIWLTATEESDAVVQQCDYFNQLLLEKDLPYQVEFIYAGSGDTFSKLQECKEQGIEPDLIGCGFHLMGDDAYASGYLAELDELLESDAGQALRSSLPSTIWDYGKIEEHTYYIYSPDASAAEYRGENQSWALIWDTELAEKYDLDLSTWQDGWKNHLDELRTVCTGEAGNPNFAPFDGFPLFYDGSNGSLIYWYFQQGTGAYIPFVFSGSIDLVTSVSQSDWLPFFEEWSGLDLLADQTLPVWAESLAELAPLDEIRFFDDCQAYDAAWGEYDDLTEREDTQVFLTRYSGSLAGFSSRFDDEFWKTHDYVVCDAVVDRNALGVRTGISSASEKQEAAMEFLAALYTDPELSNALAWGDAPVTNGLVTSGTKVFTLGGNLLVTYQRNNEDIIYQDLWQAASDTLEASLPSPLIGFSYSKEKFDLDNPTQILNLLNEYLADYMEEAQ